MIAVTKVPKKTPFVGDEVMFPRVVSSFPPATLFRASPIRDIPKRKKASPPRSDMTDAILMVFTFLLLSAQLYTDLFYTIEVDNGKTLLRLWQIFVSGIVTYV